MNCPRCQQENPPQAKFCLECATPLPPRCTNCGTQLPVGAKFCFECAAPASAPGSPPRLASPEVYTPKLLAERILNSRAALEGERKHVTVLFADLKGSMELLADRDPEDARRILDPVLELMMEAVHRYEGTVNQVMGDGIMALFGAPLAHEDHAVRACYAALRMQERVKRYSEEIRRTVGVPLAIRVGINAGEVVVRSIGSDLHMDYTAVGQTTHLAARMEQAALPSSTLLPAETLRLVEGYVHVKPLGPIVVKGLAEPVEAYELVGAATVRSRFQAAAARGLTRFVGRQTELGQLHHALARAKSGHGQVVAVVGEPGVGKSRLFWEFMHSHYVEGWLVLESTSVSYGRATSYLPVIELLKAYFQIEGRDDTRKIREKVTGKLLSLDRTLEPFLPPLLWLLDVPIEDVDWMALDPGQRRQRTLDALKRLLFRESQVQPLVVVFEDLHWIDSETQDLLEGLVESLPGARVLLLVNYRPEYQHLWSSKSHYHHLRIAPLPSEGAGELLDTLLGSDAELRSLKTILLERTEGNPFFLEESVRALVETEMLAGDRGRYRLTSAPHRLQIPATAQALLAARIDRQPPEDKRILQAAAVIGTDVPFNLLRAVTEDSDDALRQSLGRLQTAEFLYETLFPDLGYTFKHALTHEVTYGSLLHDRRRILHARIVDAIERLHADRLTEHAERLAHHAFVGEVWAKAVTYCRQGGTRAMERSANREAETWFERALASLEHLPESRENQEQAIDIRFDLRSVLLFVGEPQKMLGHLLEAERLATILNDQPRLARVSAYVTTTFVMEADYTRAVASAERALAIAETLGNAALTAEMDFRLGQVYHAVADYGRAAEVLRRRVELGEGDRVRGRFAPPFLMSLFARAWLALSLAETGGFEEGMAIAEEGIRHARDSNQPFNLIGASYGLGFLQLRRGNLPVAVEMLTTCFELCRAKNNDLFLPLSGSALGNAHVRCGNRDVGLSLLDDVRRRVAARHVNWLHALALTQLGEGYFLVGRIADAEQIVDQALDASRRHKERGSEAWALHLVGAIASRGASPRIERARTYYEQALALATELGMRPLVSHCHAGLGALYQRAGRPREADEHFATTTTMYREMGMTYWLEKATVEMRDLT